MRLLGLEIDLAIRRRHAATLDVDGMQVEVPELAAHIVTGALETRRAELAKVTDTATAAIEAARAAERSALERVEAAEARVRAVEAELAAERGGRQADRAAHEAALSAAQGERDGRHGVLLHMPARGRA